MLALVFIGCSLIFALLGMYYTFDKGAVMAVEIEIALKNKQDKYDAEALCKAIGKLSFGISIGIFLWGVGVGIKQTWVFILGLVIFFLSIFLGIFFTYVINLFKKRE